MTRWLCVPVVALALVEDGAAMAQQRAAQSRTSQSPTTAPAPTGSPTVDSRFTSRLTFDGRGLGRGRTAVPFRGAGRGVLLPGFPFVWSWDTRPFGPEATDAIAPADAPTGGVQLDVLPWRARVYVDGVYVGRVDDFKGYYHHLDVASGPHQFAIVEPGYQPLILDLVIPAGRTTTYRGALSEAANR